MIYVSLAIFLVYLANVLGGALADFRFMTDVQECLTLMFAVLFFALDIMRRDTKFKASQKMSKDNAS